MKISQIGHSELNKDMNSSDRSDIHNSDYYNRGLISEVSEDRKNRKGQQKNALSLFES